MTSAAPATPSKKKAPSRQRKGQAAAGIIIGSGLIAASIGLGIWAASVNAPCMKPYAECIGNGHAGREFGGILLIFITGAPGLLGLVLLLLSLVALLSKPKAPQQRKADFEKKVAETKARDAAKQAAEQRRREEKLQSAANELANSIAPIRLPRLGLTINDGIIYTTGKTLAETRRGDIRPLGPLIGSHATFTKLKDKQPKRHSLAYDIVVDFSSGPTPRGTVTVTAGKQDSSSGRGRRLGCS